ncbi:hypothetical protein [Okeania sp.]|uniref:hypothetical protein n=1 Tax=Okeania sp. TaxID=3100323 RepID=UPI002B4B737F|nr:hypothetical protein [Okeania sp.]MEB3340739.1 hypothetical protein [Okeania sp.]
MIAKAWREQLKLTPGYTLDTAVDNQEIDAIEKEGILLLIKCYYTLWQIVKIVETDVHSFHSFLQSIVSIADYFSWSLPQIFLNFFSNILSQKYSFDSPYELFIEILRENEDDIFSVCLRYEEISLKKAERGSELISNLLFEGIKEGFYYQPNDDEIKQIKKYFSWVGFSASWQVMVLTVSQFSVLRNPQLALKLKEFNKLTIECNDLTKTACRKRKSKTWDKRRSVAWKNGKKAYAENGVYKFP